MNNMEIDFNENERPTAKEMNLSEEFVYATRIVDMLMKVNLSKECDRNESIRIIEKAFREYKDKIIHDFKYNKDIIIEYD